MTNPNDAAFKQIANDHIFGGIQLTALGLTKREYFAAMAMQGTIAGSQGLDITSEQFAAISIKLADALIAELSK